MKNRLFGIAAAAMALLSSCETIVEQEISVEVLPAEEQTVFTANLGADTKTYLEYQDGVYKTRWAEGDYIFVLATSSDGSYWYDSADIIEGVGTSSAKFAAGSNVKGENYYAFYGPSYYNASGKFFPVLQEYQYGAEAYNQETEEWEWSDNLDGYYFPMYAQSDNKDFSFKNLCSILKVDLVGTDYIDNVVFTPNDPTIPVAGNTILDFVDGEPQLTFESDSTSAYKVCFYVRQTLNEAEPTSCYISIPPQTYTGGFTLTINSNSGSMDVVVNEDVTFERSEIRSIPVITYKNEETSTWGIVGDMTNWSEDIPMTPYEQYWVATDVYLEAGLGFKFRANGKWDVNLGAYEDYGPIVEGYWYPQAYDGMNMTVEKSGYYEVYLDVPQMRAAFLLIEEDEPEVVECESFDEVAALPDGTMVMVYGYVFAPYGRGFVMNIGNQWDNSILVYQGTDQSYYTPVMGNYVGMIAEKTTYNNLPELTNIQDFVVSDDSEYDYGYKYYYDLYNPASFANFDTDRYEYVKYAGTLEKSGSYYNVVVDGVEGRLGSIEYPIQDLTEFIGKKVSVEGWFIGFSGGGKYLKTVLRSISLIEDDGSTEDVTPGDDIVVMHNRTTIK